MQANFPRIAAGPAPIANTAPKFWAMASVSDDEGEITMYGDIMSQKPLDFWTGEPVQGQYITPAGFMEDLALIRSKAKITVKLNSVGGDLYTGIAIHNELKALKGKKTIIVDGVAASAGSVIMCAGDDVQVYPGSMVMIHNAALQLRDTYSSADLKQVLRRCEAGDAAMAAIYHEKSGIELDTIRGMMARETWMIGQEAVDKGFANTLLGGEGSPSAVLSSAKDYMLVAGVCHDIRSFHNIPSNIPISSTIVPPAASAAGINTPPAAKGGQISKEEKKPMNLEELKAQNPELVAQIQQEASTAAKAEAVTQERERIKAIDSIAATIDPQLVADAKFGDKPCTAQELAFQAMQKQAQLGAQHLDNTKADAAKSGANGVQAQPNGGDNGNGEDDTKAQVNTIVAAYNSTKTNKGGKQ